MFETGELERIQSGLRNRIRIESLKSRPRVIAGVDAAFKDNQIIGAASLYRYPEIEHIEDSYSIMRLSFPYIAGFLSFREGPAIIDALRKLREKPDLILFDGHGIAHPMGIGIASHIGVILHIPTVGCAKSRLVGEYQEPGPRKGDWSPLVHNGRIVGAVLRTKDNIKPVFVSPGHMINLKNSIEVISETTGKFKLPEPLRHAHALSVDIKNRLTGKM